MPKTWILVADAHRARCFERSDHSPDQQELADFVLAQRRIPHGKPRDPALADDRKGHGRSAHAGTQFEPHTDAHALERGRFAGELASYLNDGVAHQHCDALALIATGPMLGELRSRLSPAASQRLSRAVDLDLTHFVGPELQQRMTEALAARG